MAPAKMMDNMPPPAAATEGGRRPTDVAAAGGAPNTPQGLSARNGYAAFPDPGPLVISAPGLLTGLLSGGGGGLPPISLPTLPSYPLFVASDPALHPDSSAGAGPNVRRTDSTCNAGLVGTHVRASAAAPNSITASTIAAPATVD